MTAQWILIYLQVYIQPSIPIMNNDLFSDTLSAMPPYLFPSVSQTPIKLIYNTLDVLTLQLASGPGTAGQQVRVGGV